MFGSRAAIGLFERIRGYIWPRSGWWRAISYRAHRLGRLPASPHSVAAGFACGVAVAITPFLGLQFLLAALLALLVRGKVTASLIGSFFANPWTVPIIWVATYRLGNWMLLDWYENMSVDFGDILEVFADFSEALLAGDVQLFMTEVWPIWFPMIIGSLPLGLAAWFVVYWPARALIKSYQERRVRRRLAGLARRSDAASVGDDDGEREVSDGKAGQA